MQLQPFRTVKHALVMITLALAIGGAAFAGVPGVTSAEETCVATTFGTTVCTETFVLDVQTYSVEVVGVQSCQKGKGKAKHPAEQLVSTLETHEVTEYEIVTKTFFLGNLASVDYTMGSTDTLASSETISVGKCHKIKD